MTLGTKPSRGWRLSSPSWILARVSGHRDPRQLHELLPPDRRRLCLRCCLVKLGFLLRPAFFLGGGANSPRAHRSYVSGCHNERIVNARHARRQAYLGVALGLTGSWLGRQVNEPRQVVDGEKSGGFSHRPTPYGRTSQRQSPAPPGRTQTKRGTYCWWILGHPSRLGASLEAA